MIGKFIVGSAIGYGGIQFFASDQMKNDCNGFINGFLNSFGAIYCVGISVFDYKWNLRNIEYNTPQYYKDRSVIHQRVAERILKLSLKNRGVYLKAGQYIGNLDRVMPKEYIKVLKVLQDNGPSQSYDQIKIVVEHDLKTKIDDIFSQFNQNAIAAASLAQVHEATLKENNQKVAVKIQFPQLRTQYKYDLGVLRYISRFCDIYMKLVSSETLELAQLFQTFRNALEKELDFKIEEKNGVKTKALYQDIPQIHIPSYYTQYCTSRVLVMEFVEGVKINDLEGIKKFGLKNLDVANILIELFGRMIFQHGHVHCDAHPGNILVKPWDQDNSKPQILLLDHGFYSEIDAGTLNLFRKMWVSLAEFNYKEAAKCARDLGIEESHIDYLPLIFFYRTKNSTKKLGAEFSKEERTYVRNKDLATLENVSKLMRSMPPELLFVIRASNLVGMHNANLGGTTRMRLKRFTALALEGIYTNSFIRKFKWEFLRFKLFLFENLYWLYLHIFKINEEDRIADKKMKHSALL